MSVLQPKERVPLAQMTSDVLLTVWSCQDSNRLWETYFKHQELMKRLPATRHFKHVAIILLGP